MNIVYLFTCIVTISANTACMLHRLHRLTPNKRSVFLLKIRQPQRQCNSGYIYSGDDPEIPIHNLKRIVSEQAAQIQALQKNQTIIAERCKISLSDDEEPITDNPITSCLSQQFKQGVLKPNKLFANE